MISQGKCQLQDKEKEFVTQLQSLMPTYRARPSLLGPVASAAGFALGAAAGVLPSKLSHAITGKVSHPFTYQQCLVWLIAFWTPLTQIAKTPPSLTPIAYLTVLVKSALVESNIPIC